MDSFQVDLAVKFCERALELEPSNVYVLNTMATVLLEAGDTDKAFEVTKSKNRHPSVIR